MSGKYSNMPLWAKIVIIVAALPVLAYPWLLSASAADSEERTFLWFYPIYVVASVICAWICWPDRREVSWILIIIMLFSHASILLLINN